MIDAGLLDEVMDRVDAGGLELTGEGGFLPVRPLTAFQVSSWPEALHWQHGI